MNKRVAILATNGFEESELKSPLEAMKNEGFTVDIVSQESPYYGVANMKMYIEKQSLFYSKLNRTKFSILRHSNIYGPHDKFNENTSHVLPNLIKGAI